jgi:hypothetical protein
MNIEVEVCVGSDPFVVCCYMDEFASIGRKKFIDIGKFEYEWFDNFLTRDDLIELAGALVFIADHIPETTENEETGE